MIRLVLPFLLFTILPGCGSDGPGTIPERPNILIILADDLGYSDPGCYGGEIRTPHIDGLAKEGIQFTQFYNAARCCPTRASLMTGHYQHAVGLALNGRNLSGKVPTLAEILLANGYHTGMAGKWHLSRTRAVQPPEEQLKWMAHQADHGPFAPVESYPSRRGFEEHWGVIWGVVNYFDPFSLVHNEDPVTEVPDDFYITDFITRKSVELIESFTRDDRPFFIYVAHTAPHWPLHALPEDLERYQGVYDGGWEKLRADRYRRLLELGLIDRETYPVPENSSGRSWSECRDKEVEANHMEAHAAMVDRMDQGIGKILRKLEETGELENTLIMFLADNGASYERGYPPGFDRPGYTREGIPIDYSPEIPGAETTWGYLGAAWASAVNTPWRYWKKESYEGGIHTPFVAYWPAGFSGLEGTLNHGVAHVMDILPTCLDVAGIPYPDQFRDYRLSLPDGHSMIPMIQGDASATSDTIYWEHEGGKAIRTCNWKMAALPDEPWELFDLSVDHTEVYDLSAIHPDRVKEMTVLWEAWAQHMGIRQIK